ncbi:MAG: hypothetical protein F4039_07350 [Gammaproteobacteria bacterium]|nr:hypothetical protein [Gammaproteobacteria bacterium]MYK43885.1 hypothetical protein [Gammaproteobacteria bacterium]
MKQNLTWEIDPNCLESRHHKTIIAKVDGACFEIEHVLGMYRAIHNTPDDTLILSNTLNATVEQCKSECEKWYLDHYTDYRKLKSQRDDEALALNDCSNPVLFRKHVARIEDLEQISNLLE